MFRNVFVLGPDQHNLEILRRLPGAADLAFHRLLRRVELQGALVDVRELLDRAEEELDAFDGPIDAIVSFWDFPMVTMLPILCARRGLPSADLLAVLRCEHKYWARVVQAAAIDTVFRWPRELRVSDGRVSFEEAHVTMDIPGPGATPHPLRFTHCLFRLLNH
jgi:hypothetical protein